MYLYICVHHPHAVLMTSCCVFVYRWSVHVLSTFQRYKPRSSENEVNKYNALPGERTITWEDATDLTSSLLCHARGTHSGIPRNIRLSAIKNHHLALRADEDIHLLQTEMHSTFCFFLDDWKHLLSTIVELKLQPYSKYNNGALNQLQLVCLKCEGVLLDLRSAFSTFVDLPVLPVDTFMRHTLCIPTMYLQELSKAELTVEVSSDEGDMSHYVTQTPVVTCV